MSYKQFQLDQIPSDLKNRPQWVGFTVKDGEKTPYIADDPKRKASSTNSKTWRTFDMAVSGIQSGAFDAIAYALDKDFTGIDIDGCFPDGVLIPYAADIMKRCASYAETSFSGNGIHILLKGVLPTGNGRRLPGIELYDQKRFFIITGNRLPESPVEIRENPAAVSYLLEEHVTETAEQAEQAEAIFSSSPSLSACSVTSSLDDLILMTRPKRPRERNRRLFDFARGLRFNMGLENHPIRELKPYVRLWYEAALPIIRTKEFTESWCDFVYAWKRARLPLGADGLTLAWKQSQTGPAPAVASEYDSEPVRHLVGLCAALACFSPDSRFFLSTHKKVPELLNTTSMQVYRWLNMLVADGVLKKVHVGNEHRATRYQWIAPKEGGAGMSALTIPCTSAPCRPGKHPPDHTREKFPGETLQAREGRATPSLSF